DPVMSFRYRDNPQFLAISSHFTRAHWDERLRWLIHEPVQPEGVDRLGQFADGILGNSSGLSKAEFIRRLDSVRAEGLEGELLEYWRKNLDAFPDTELTRGLQQLTLEVQQDLREGPEKAIAELQELQAL